MTALAARPWVPTETYIQSLADLTARRSSAEVSARIELLIERNTDIHERECFNLNPATNMMNGLRFGTPELVRWGMTEADMPKLAVLIAEALRANDPESIAPRTAAYRRQFQELHYIRQ